MVEKVLKIHSKDTVAVAIEYIKKGETITIDGKNYTTEEDIPKGHKIALKNYSNGENVIKYGYAIGHLTKDVKVGERIHTHNMKTNLGEILTYQYNPTASSHIAEKLWSDATVDVYKRENGDIGIRNELWIVPLVGCINSLSDRIKERFESEYDLSHTDGMFVWKHPFGCSQLGFDLEYTQRFLASLATHPNAGGVLLIGLGCENNTLESFLPFLGEFKNSQRIKYFIAQEVEDEIEVGISYLKELSENMKKDKREKSSFFNLRIGLKCGGSDGLSGITANPLEGNFVDSFTKGGGCVLMTEVPEMFGAETILMNRAENVEVFKNIVNLINNFKKYYEDNNQPIYENPSPGNKDGGITTLEDKSLGCTQKGGHSIVSGVLGYSCKLPKEARNLWLIEGPGNDQISVSNLAACGAHIVLFSTGRGTPFGGFVPCIKISSNSELAERKSNWIDFDAGRLLKNSNMLELTKELGILIQKVASGKQTKNEKSNNREVSIFKKGVTL